MARAISSKTFSILSGSVALVAISLVSGGCQNAISPFETKSLFDPSKVGRWEKDPLVKPILDDLSVGEEESESQFVTARDVKESDLNLPAADYVIISNDVVQVSITDLVAPGVETVKSIRVSETGKISLPLMPQPLMAKGLTEQQLERAIGDAYRDAQVIQNAQVSVTVTEARGRTYSVLGNVQQPGQYSLLDSDYRLLDALVATHADVNTNGQGVENIFIIRKKTKDITATTDDSTTKPSSVTKPKPGVDPLAPTSSIGNTQPRRSVLLMQEPGKPSGDRIVVIDGKEVVMPKPADATKPDPTPTTPAAETTPSTPTTPAIPVTTPEAVPAVQPVIPTTDPAATTEPTSQPAEFGGFQALKEPDDREIIRVPYGPLKGGQLKYNIAIRPGDLIFVPSPITGNYYMGGDVNGAGAYSISPSKITLTQAIVAARGLTDVAWPSRTEIVRRLPGNRQVFVRVDLDKIFSGQEPDIYLKPDDRVNVGTNALMPFLSAIRNGFRFSYGLGFTYDRNFYKGNNNNNNNNN